MHKNPLSYFFFQSHFHYLKRLLEFLTDLSLHRLMGCKNIFNQGFQMMYAFTKVDAARSFKAQKLDPTCSMCFWGKLGPGDLFKWKNARSGSAKSLYIHSGRSRISSRRLRYRKRSRSDCCNGTQIS